MAELLPFCPPHSLPDLLNGIGTAYKQRPIWSPRQWRALSQARALLAPYGDRTVWYKALDKYATYRRSCGLFQSACGVAGIRK